MVQVPEKASISINEENDLEGLGYSLKTISPITVEKLRIEY